MLLIYISGKSRKITKKSYLMKWKKQVKNLDYEKAAIARDRIKALTQIQSSQKINQTNLNEADVISIFKESRKNLCTSILF
jgi:excinuclease ABC subunit C